MKEMNEYQWDVLESAIRSLQREKYNFFQSSNCCLLCFISSLIDDASSKKYFWHRAIEFGLVIKQILEIPLPFEQTCEMSTPHQIFTTIFENDWSKGHIESRRSPLVMHEEIATMNQPEPKATLSKWRVAFGSRNELRHFLVQRSAKSIPVIFPKILKIFCRENIICPALFFCFFGILCTYHLIEFYCRDLLHVIKIWNLHFTSRVPRILKGLSNLIKFSVHVKNTSLFLSWARELHSICYAIKKLLGTEFLLMNHPSRLNNTYASCRNNANKTKT